MAKGSSRIFRLFLGLFIILLGFIVVVSVIGWIGDKSIESKIVADRENALEDLNSLKRHDPGNAWEYYSQAIEKAEKIKSDRTLNQCTNVAHLKGIYK